MVATTAEAMMNMPSYEELAKALEGMGSDIGPAEVHGLLCGFICAGSKVDGVAWTEPLLGQITKGDMIAKEARELILQLYQNSSRQLKDMEFGFQLLLPDDETDLSLRAQELSYWCHGFLTGLGLADVHVENVQSEEVYEVLEQFTEISKLDYEVIEISEEDERAFFEVYEYVRMAALMVYGELAGAEEDEADRILH